MCFSYSALSLELDFLCCFFSDNGFPDHVFHNICKKFFDKIYQPANIFLIAPKNKVYFYLFPSTTRTVLTFQETLVNNFFFFPHLDIKFSFKNNYTIAYLFRFKDRLPAECLSNVIYKYTCGSCNATYGGSTRQKSKVRFHQHLGTSHRY